MNKNFWFKFKIITLISIIVWINNIIFLNASEYSLKKGWNLIGIHQNNFDIEKFPNTHTIWKYKDNNWYVASTNSNVLNFIKDHNIKTFSAVNASDGIWIELLKETNEDEVIIAEWKHTNPRRNFDKHYTVVTLKRIDDKIYLEIDGRSTGLSTCDCWDWYEKEAVKELGLETIDDVIDYVKDLEEQFMYSEEENEYNEEEK